MPDFSAFNQFKADDKIASYTVPLQFPRPDGTLAPSMVLQVRHAGKGTPAYHNAQMRGVRRKIHKANQVTTQTLAEISAEDRKLFAKHIVTAWANVLDTATWQPVPFSPGACEALLVAMPDHIFDGLRDFASDADNFSTTEIDPVDLGKPSAPA